MRFNGAAWETGWHFCPRDSLNVIINQPTCLFFEAAAAAAVIESPPSSTRRYSVRRQTHQMTREGLWRSRRPRGKLLAVRVRRQPHQMTREGLWRSRRPRGKLLADRMMCNGVGRHDGLTREHRTRVNEQHTRSRPARSATTRP